MRLESAIITSTQGLTAHGQAIAVVGDNISNASTPAFKRGRAEFVDIMGEVAGARNAEVVTGAGDGVFIGRTRLNFERGAIDSTGRELDIAVNGNGFFLVGDPAAPRLTRMGAFQVGSDGILTTASGDPVLGYQGADTATLVPLNMTQVNPEATPTTQVQAFGNLDASLPLATLPAAGATFQEINGAASFVASQSVYDSLGERHDVTLCYFKIAPNQWTVQSYINGAETGGGANTPVLLGQAQLQFNTTGVIDEANAPAAVINASPAWANGAAQGNFSIDLSAFTQYAGGSRLTNSVQDGKGGGDITGYSIDGNGGVFAILDSGEQAVVGTLPVALVQNVDGLERNGSSLYSTTARSGQAVVGVAGRGGIGELRAGSLESSNVDIANQFVDLVIYQRGYQANSQVLSAASEMIKGTIALIR
jgi:flagellar hook protein FlgE